MQGPAGLVAGRVAQAVLVALVVGIVSFIMMQALPGDAAFRIAAGRYGYDIMDAAAAEAVRIELGLDRPLIAQLGTWLTQLFTLNLGNSLVSGEPVWDELSHQLGASLLLAITSIMASVLIAIPFGIAAGLSPGSRFDRISLAMSVGLRSVPAFAMGVVLMLFLAVEAKLLPVAGYGELHHLILPSLTLGLGLAAVSNRVIRDSVLAATQSEWFSFARTKGLGRWTALRRHALRNAAVPAVAYVGVQLAFLIEGVVIIESVFAWPGIGHALVHAIFERDIPMVQGTVLVLGLLFVVLSLIVDITCRALDPRETSRPV